MSKVLSFRVSDDEAAWADEYAKGRGVSRQEFLAAGFRSYREDCERGVPEVAKDVPRPKLAARGETQADWALARQQKLNEAMLRSRAR